MKKALLTFAFLVAGTGIAAAADFQTLDTSIGEVLVGDNGMTLYTFRNDKAGTSNCYDKCAVAWPPYIAASDAKAEGAYSLVERKDGSMQWAKDGMPLYYWIKDKKTGDVTGEGVNGVWDAARP